MLFHQPHFPAGWVGESVGGWVSRWVGVWVSRWVGGWVGAVCSLTLFISEGSPWSEVPLCSPAQPSAAEVIHGDCTAHTSTRTELTHRCSLQGRGDEEAREDPKGERLVAAQSKHSAAVQDGSLILKPVFLA